MNEFTSNDATGGPAATPPHERQINNPYYILRTPQDAGRSGHYFYPEYNRLVTSSSEPISRFLAKAFFKEGGKGEPPVINYDFSGIDVSTMRPMDYLPQCEIDAFRRAAEAFYERARPEARNVPPYEKQLRLGFKLPDPDLERDCYWVYGPENNRRLLILWGAEKERNASLPLVPHPATRDLMGYSGGKTVWDKFRTMSAEEMQREALKLIMRNPEPIGRFLLLPHRDDEGNIKAYGHGPNFLKPEKLSNLGRVLHPTYKAFAQAAVAYYAPLAANDDTISDYEKMLRANLRFPDFSKKPDAFLSNRRPVGSRLYISMDPKLADADAIPLAPGNPRHATPAKPEDAQKLPWEDEKGPKKKDGPETLVDQLGKRVVAPALLYGAAAVMLLALCAVIFGLYESIDRKGPELLSKQPITTPDAQTVAVHFNEPLYLDDFAAPDAREADLPPLLVQINGPEGIIPAVVITDPAQPDMISLRPEKLLVTDVTYTLMLSGIRDNSMNKNVMEKSGGVEFQYLDSNPPKLVMPSASPDRDNTLELIFDEALDPGSVAQATFSIPGSTLQGRPEVKGDVVYLQFKPRLENNVDYLIDIEGVTDLHGNTMEPISGKKFTFKDQKAPEIIEAVADGTAYTNQVWVLVKATEALAPHSLDSAEFTLNKGSEPVQVLAALPAKADPRNFYLRVPPLERGMRYTLNAAKLEDVAGNTSAANEAPLTFVYQGPVRSAAPRFDTQRSEGADTVSAAGKTLTVTLHEPLSQATIDRLKDIKGIVVHDAFNTSAKVNIASVQIDHTFTPEAGAETVLTANMSDNLSEGEPPYILRLDNVEDVFGMEAPALRIEFRARGVGAPTPPLALLAGRKASATTIVLTFNQAVDGEMASMPANYRSNDGRSPQQATWSESKPEQVTLTFDNAGSIRTLAVSLRPQGNPNAKPTTIAWRFVGGAF